MKRLWIYGLLLLLGAAGSLQAQGKGTLVFRELDLEKGSRGHVANLCLTAPKEFEAGNRCAQTARLEVRFKRGKGELDVRTVCRWLVENHPGVSQDNHWLVGVGTRASQPSYEIDCDDLSDRRISAGDPINGAGTGTPKPADRLEKWIEKLRKIEEELEGLHDRMKSLETGALESEGSCLRFEDEYHGRPEVMITVERTTLRFLQLPARSEPIPIGLTEPQAESLLKEAQRGLRDPIFPHLLLAVPSVDRTVDEFYLQDRLIDPPLYHRLVGGNARRVSHRETRRFIQELNARCEGTAVFALPTEEQLVAAGHLLYNPVLHGLKPCKAVGLSGPEQGLSQLLGHAWQLTTSPCKQFGPDAPSCPERSYIRKGGTESSENPLECIPEYRGVAPENVAQKDTSFRLVLAK